MAGFIKSKFPDEQELPPSLFVAPPLQCLLLFTLQ
jgi:hypothetical protein